MTTACDTAEYYVAIFTPIQVESVAMNSNLMEDELSSLFANLLLGLLQSGGRLIMERMSVFLPHPSNLFCFPFRN
jgi:hypothetical protein